MTELQNVEEFELDEGKIKDNLINGLQQKVLELTQQNLLLQANFNTAFDELRETYDMLTSLREGKEDPFTTNKKKEVEDSGTF
tara:strand:+ start:16300 stop:16548 length:249 start_codon:yes stop_codon:yes gene_type:complete